MDKSTSYIILTVLKVIAIIAGGSLALKDFIPGIVKKDSIKIKKAVIVFISTFVLIAILTAIEFIIAFG